MILPPLIEDGGSDGILFQGEFSAPAAATAMTVAVQGDACVCVAACGPSVRTFRFSRWSPLSYSLSFNLFILLLLHLPYAHRSFSSVGKMAGSSAWESSCAGPHAPRSPWWGTLLFAATFLALSTFSPFEILSIWLRFGLNFELNYFIPK